MRVFGGFVQENVLHNDAFHRRQSRCYVLRVRVGLHNVFALAIQTKERTVHGCIKHIGDAQAGFGAECDAPCAFKQCACGGVRDMAVAGQLVWEAAHVASTLHIVLTTQGVHTHTFASDHAASH